MSPTGRNGSCGPKRVSASFEASLSGDLVTLIENFPLDEPDWGKPMMKPTSNLAEDAARSDDVAQCLRNPQPRDNVPGRHSDECCKRSLGGLAHGSLIGGTAG